MPRWPGMLLALAVGLAAATVPAHAQVFKPKASKTADTAATKPTRKGTSRKPGRKRPSARKAPAAERDRADEPAPAPAGKDDADFVKITDDEEIE